MYPACVDYDTYGSFFKVPNNKNTNTYDSKYNSFASGSGYMYLPKIANLVVKSEARRSGLGSLLVSQCIKEAKKQGYYYSLIYYYYYYYYHYYY
jgi:ribosomal protein S18 acetylase RimI-like enzyme